MIFTFILAKARAAVRDLRLDADTERRVLDAIDSVRVPGWVALSRRMTLFFALQAVATILLIKFAPMSTVARVVAMSDVAGDALVALMAAVAAVMLADVLTPARVEWFRRWRWVPATGLSVIYVALVGAIVLADIGVGPAQWILAGLWTGIAAVSMWTAFADRWAALQVAWLERAP